MYLNPMPGMAEIRVICSLHGRQMALFLWAQKSTPGWTGLQLSGLAQTVRNHLRDTLWPLLGFNCFLQVVRAQDRSIGFGPIGTSFPASTAGGMGIPTLPSSTALALTFIVPSVAANGYKGVFIPGIPAAVTEGNFLDSVWCDQVVAAVRGLQGAIGSRGATWVQPRRYLNGSPLAVATAQPILGVRATKHEVSNLRRRAPGYPQE